MARHFIVDGTEYPDPGAEVTPGQFKQMMAGFFPELANADVKETDRGEDKVFQFQRKVGTKGY